jgi:hypothetical protein
MCQADTACARVCVCVCVCASKCAVFGKICIFRRDSVKIVYVMDLCVVPPPRARPTLAPRPRSSVSSLDVRCTRPVRVPGTDQKEASDKAPVFLSTLLGRLLPSDFFIYLYEFVEFVFFHYYSISNLYIGEERKETCGQIT